MKRLNTILLILFAFSLITVSAGCTNDKTNPQPISEMNVFESIEMTPEQLSFFDDVSISIGTVNSSQSSASVTVTIPDLKEYLQKGNPSSDIYQIIELEFPVHQVDGIWQISSMDPLTDYIRAEATQILLDRIEENGSIIIDFNPQEVIEE